MRGRKRGWRIVFLFFFIEGLAAVAMASPSRIYLRRDQTNLALLHDWVILRTQPIKKPVSSLRCEVEGPSLQPAGREGNPTDGYRFVFLAVRPGESFVAERILKAGPQGESIITRRYRIRVEGIAQIPRVTIKELRDKAARYSDGFVIIKGVNRGWGGPVSAQKIWGTLVTRSDWVLEDPTGAVYVRGRPGIRKGEEFTAVYEVRRLPDGKWILIFHKNLQRGTQNSQDSVVKGINAFGFDLYPWLTRGKLASNIFFSPFSISGGLVMTYTGARGTTARQMARVLHVTGSKGRFQRIYAELLKRLEVLSTGKGEDLRMANALWGQKGYGFLLDFKETVKKYYAGGFHEVDFARDLEGARSRINNWIEKKTEKKIKNLIAQGDIDPLTRLVLTNAVYFKGTWAAQFGEEKTKLMPFHVSPEKSVSVPMMYQKGIFPYYRDKNVQALELPYAGGALSMVILLPVDRGGLPDLERHFNGQDLDRWLSRLRKREIEVSLPRFRLKAKYYLARDLAAMGMADAFSDRADFSGMTGKKDLRISKVIHQAFVEVNEKGTEAAASTAVTMRLKAVFREPVFKADHPFLFLIRHNKTGLILFMGRLVEP